MTGAQRAPLGVTARAAEAARASAMESAFQLFGSTRLPPCLHGPEGVRSSTHGHAYWLSEDRDGDGRLDHLTVYAPAGLDEAAEAILDGMHTLTVKPFETYELRPAFLDSTAMGPGRLWRSSTPYFGPLHAWRGSPHRRKPGKSAADQLEADVRQFLVRRAGHTLGFIVRPRPDATSPTSYFRLTERLAKKCPSHPVRGWFEIEFDVPVLGPISLGFGAHFGLGQFRAALPERASPATST